MKRVKVLHISQATGGVQKHVLYLVKGMDKKHFEAIGACPTIDRVKKIDSSKTSFPQALQEAGIRAVNIDMYRQINPLRDLISFLKIFNLIKKEKFNIVHTHSSKAGFLGRLAAKLLGVPVILHTPNAFAFDRPNRAFFGKRFYIWLERVAANWCDMIIAVSESERNLALKYKITSPDKLTVINNAINLEGVNDIFRMDTKKKKQSLGIDVGKKIVITVARLALQKAPFDFVKVATHVIGRRKDVMFFMVGDGPLIGKTKKFIRKNKLENYVKLLGWRTDAKELIYISDVFVLTSLWEGLPYTAMEAMALKKAVVATDVTGTKDLIRDGYNGYLIPPQRADLLAEKVLKLLDEPGLSRDMGLRGRDILDKMTSLKEHIKATENLYMKLLAQKVNKEKK